MKARSIEIDGETYSVCRCADCPCYDGGDNGYGERCKHPKGDGKCAEVGGWSKDDCEFGQYNPKAEDVFGPSCPLKDGEDEMSFPRRYLEYIASRINGMEYGQDIPSDIVEEAKRSGIAIVFGGSDDLMEFRGAFNEELGAWIGDEGKTKDFTSSKGRIITAEWCRYPTISWTYKSEIRSESFIVNEDGSPYCIGMVFYIEEGETWGEGE